MARKQGDKFTARETAAAEAQDEVEAIRGIFLAVGHALTLTIMSAMLPPGHVAEDEAIKEAGDAWEHLADKVIAFAMED